ncbi:hydroxypyruvate isomerase [Spirochaetia bacterium]|nr:hydroxypyruvate isomerase [Spirochaetia bacterium]
MAAIGICIDPVFMNLPYTERVRKIAALGFKKYEFWSENHSLTDKGMIHEQKDFSRFAELNAEYGLEITDILYEPGKDGVKANLISRGDTGKLVDNFGALAEQSRKIGCPAFIITGGTVLAGQSRDTSLLNLFYNVSALVKEAEKHRITLLLEPLNVKIDHRDTFLWDPQTAVDIVKAVNSPFLKVLYDIYHMQIMGGNILAFVKENLNHIGHFHIASVPGRNEPYRGELDYGQIVREITGMGYTGNFGLEYWPTEDVTASLGKSLRCLMGGE